MARTETIAVLGAKATPGEVAHTIPAYLAAAGYQVIGVSPKLTGDLFGQPTRSTLAEIQEAIDLVDVFRQPAALPGHVDEILALPTRPKAVWLQLGVEHPPSTARLLAAGIDVVRERCIMVDHRQLLGSARS